MLQPSAEKVQQILQDLIALPTVNPMGRPFERSTPVERPVIEYLEQQFAKYGLEMRRLACSSRHESLLITIPGTTDTPGTLLESHIDTVPADDWLDRAFAPRLEAGRIYGRGACDDKGSLAAMAVALLEMLDRGQSPPQTVWFLAAGDEEHAQTGIQHFLANHRESIGRAIFGEPTELVPIIQHKGTIRWDITVHGKSAHTSRPELGCNAILQALRVIERIAEHEHDLQQRHRSDLMSGPSICVTMIHGGRTRNMVPDECTIAVDFRILPGMDRRQAVDELFAQLAVLDIPLTHSDFQCFAPALNTAADSRFVRDSLQICRAATGREIAVAGVPYGSDAGWMSAHVPTIVLGPGNISAAHAIDEYVDVEELAQGAAIYRELITRDWCN
jgi:acetylornithine deacetylase/succinyl-diaminopimelate desuccinylase-like protein